MPELGLPMDVHSRKASLDTLNIIKKYLVKRIIHNYSGSLEMAQLFIKHGCSIAFGASVLFPNSKKPTHDIVGMPLDKLLIETEASYQRSIKGHTHELADVKAIYEKICEIRGIGMDEFAGQVEANFDSVFFYETRN